MVSIECIKSQPISCHEIELRKRRQLRIELRRLRRLRRLYRLYCAICLPSSLAPLYSTLLASTPPSASHNLAFVEKELGEYSI